MNYRKPVLIVVILAWTAFVIAAYFAVQKPLTLQVADQLTRSIWSLGVTTILLLNAMALGLLTIQRFVTQATEDASLLALAGGIGLGELGLLGFGLAAVGASSFLILLTIQVILFGWFLWTGSVQIVISLVKNSIAQIRSSCQTLPRWMPWAAIFAFVLTFLMTLLPPVDAFDALLYHLTIPERWLQDGGLKPYNIPHYWFPGLVEGIYLWGLGLGSEIVPQQTHLAYALCTILLLWDWTRRLWGDLAAGWALMFFISMPSLLLLSSWAYTDLALIFFGLSTLYTLALGKEQKDTRWWALSAVSAGMAMGVKYTSFVIPVTAVLLIAIWNLERRRDLSIEILKFGFISALTGMIWYLRNWIWMGNPIYPFLFGGRYWDEFRSLWFATPGTGVGWDPAALILLPLTITLGYRDINSIDADIGPLLLLALPIALWAVVRKKAAQESQQITLTIILFFSLFSAAFWTYGYITTRDLWQTRLLLPAIVPFVIPMSVGIVTLRELDIRWLRLSYIISVVAAMSIYLNLLDTGLSIITRNPLAVAAGLTTNQSYLENYQPGYAYAIQAISKTGNDSNVYFLFEPRSYGMPWSVQPDPILDNFSHDVFLHGDPQSIINAWQQQGYTHVLLNRRSASFVLEKAEEQAALNETIASLVLISTSEDGSYELLEIHSRAP